MKFNFAPLCVLVLFSFGACQKYDDSQLRDLITNLQKENTELRTQMADIKGAESSINSDIKALNQLVSTLETSNRITNVTALPDGSGYTIEFASGEPVTVYNGVKGEDGLTPKISVGLYEGIYYWTLDGEWLTDDSGNKLRVTGDKGDTGATGEVGKDGADGKDGITPQFMIVDGNWKVSYDNGASWSNAGSATASCGIVGATVDEKTKTITLTLSDGTKIPISYSGGSSAGNPWEGKMEVVLIKAGTFTMGSPETESGRDDDEIRHQVTLTQDFYIGKYEVTNAQFCDFLNDNGIGSDGKYATSDYGSQLLIVGHKTNPMYSDGKWSPQSGYDNNPVEYVTWYGANEYAKWIGGALPTEAQWEYACRAGSTTAYCFGDESDCLGDYAWYYGNSSGKTHPVGQKKPNAWGLYDMHGNVWEWCADWFGDYSGEAETDPTGPTTGSGRVVRGGGWDYEVTDCRSAFRYFDAPDCGYYSYGFRVCFPSGSTI